MTDLPELELTNVGARNWTYFSVRAVYTPLTVEPPRQPLDCDILEANFNYTKWGKHIYLVFLKFQSLYQ